MSIRNTADLTNAPAHSEQAEQVVLGSCIQTWTLLQTVQQTLDTDDFYEVRNATIFDTLTAMKADGDPIEAASVITRLKRDGVLDRIGGPEYIVSLYRQSSPQNVAYYAGEIREQSIRRRLSSAGFKAMQEAADGSGVDVLVALGNLAAEVTGLQMAKETRKPVSLSDSMLALFDQIDPNNPDAKGLRLTPTGIPELDRRLKGGLKPGQFCLVGARTGVGKSHLGVQAAAATAILAAEVRPVLLFTLEMEHTEVATRLAAHVKAPGRHRLDSAKILSGNLTDSEWDILADVSSLVSEAPLVIDDNPRQTVSSIRAAAETAKRQHGDLGLIVLDYIQLVRFDKSTGDRRVDLEDMSRQLKVLAKDLEVPILAMAQLNRESTKRADGRPTESDLREADGFAQDADVIVLIDRPEKRNPDERLGEADIYLAKCRTGGEGVFPVAFLPQHSLFQDYHPEPAAAPTKAWSPTAGL